MKLTLESPGLVRHYGGPGAVYRRLGAALNRSPGTVHQLLNGPTGPFERVKDILATAMRLGLREFAQARLDELAAVVRQPPEAPLSVLIEAAQTADAAEDVAEVRYHIQPTEDRRDAWKRQIDREMIHLAALRDAL